MRRPNIEYVPPNWQAGGELMTGTTGDIIRKHDYAPLKTSEWVRRSNRQGDDTDTQAAGNGLNRNPGNRIKACHYDFSEREKKNLST